MGRRGRKTDPVRRKQILDLIEDARRNGARYSFACAALNLSVRTYERWKKDIAQLDRRRGPHRISHRLSDLEEKRILEISVNSEFKDKSPSYIVPRLADKGIYLGSESSFYRILRRHKLLAHRRRSKLPERRNLLRPVASGPNQVWSWDITYLRSPVRGQFFYLYMITDIFSRKIVGWRIYDKENSQHGSELFMRSLSSEKISGDGLVLHSDNGGPMKGSTMLATLQKLGVIPSFSRPSVSDDNPFSESLFKTLKYLPSFPNRPFQDFYECHRWVNDFVEWYNHEHLHSGIKFVTPSDRHKGLDVKILARRALVYQAARAANPMRWRTGIRNWDPVQKVYLNPCREQREEQVA